MYMCGAIAVDDDLSYSASCALTETVLEKPLGGIGDLIELLAVGAWADCEEQPPLVHRTES